MKLILQITFLFLLTNFLFSQTFSEKWQTEFERSNYLSTADYQNTMDYFEQFAESPYVEFSSFGISPQGRKLNYLIVSKHGFDLKNRTKPVIFIQNGIHSGEIEGKDACMLLLREILVTKEKEDLLENAVLVIVPIFSVDAHERKSPYNRINQNGPTEMGWRTTAQNYNLNRDYIKADAPEMQALLNLFQKSLPDFFIDTHTTDGADYQYTITYDVTRYHNVTDNTRKLINSKFIPFAEKFVENSGFLISPYVGFIKNDAKNGIRSWVAGPRFSQGYSAIQNRPGLLIETHMLKPYKDRVFSTKALLEAVIRFVNDNSSQIIAVNKEADSMCINGDYKKNEGYPVDFEITDTSIPYNFRGIEYENRYSKIAGESIKFFTGVPFEVTVPYFNEDSVSKSIAVPQGYLIPKEYAWLVEKLKLHGINAADAKDFISAEVEQFKFKNVKFAGFPYENHFRPNFEYDKTKMEIDLANNSDSYFYIDCSQRALGTIIHSLEPDAGDSFVRWGFFNQIFEQKEYFESYSMEPIAQKMYIENPELKKEFDELVNNDPEFAKSPRRRLNFFYEKSKYYDSKLYVYPVLRVLKIN